MSAFSDEYYGDYEDSEEEEEFEYLGYVDIRLDQKTRIFKYDFWQLGCHYLVKNQQNSIFIFFLDPL